MAEKVDEKTTAPVLPLSVEAEGVDKKKKQQQARSSVLDLLPTVRAVILRTLSNAGMVTFSFAFGAACYMLIDTIVSSHPPLAAQAPSSWLLRSASAVGKTTEAEGKTETLDLVLIGVLWCAAPQAAAGVLALMLPSHRRRLRLLLAYVGLLGNIVVHCLYAALVRVYIFVAGDLAVVGLLYFLRTAGTVAIVMVAADDLLCFLGLLLRGGEDQ